MASLYPPLPYLERDPNPISDPSDITQLKLDTANVVEGRVSIETFVEEYRTKIMNFYRFSCLRYNSDDQIVDRLTQDTLDVT